MDRSTRTSKRRALILAGGGLKVAYQAGVLQVWLDEAGLEFDLADGASGGTFNLAMYCQGMSGTTIADNWRNFNPSLGIDFNWTEYLKLFCADSLFELTAFREKVFPGWGLDWDAIRQSEVEATFNVYNFTKHELEVLTPDRMTEDFLVACVSLPMWFPPVEIGESLYIDPVYVTDANLEEAIARGADELWIIWTVSERSDWHGGFVNHYFQIIETAANGNFKRVLSRIDRNNATIDQGGHGEFGRVIDVKLLKAEVPLNYLINLTRDRMAEAVNLGVRQARQWCADNGVALRRGREYPARETEGAVSLAFTEEMKGYVALGADDPTVGSRVGKERGTRLMFRLTITVEDVDRFVTSPEHEARAEGYIECGALGGRLPVDGGTINILTHDEDLTRKKMRYRVYFRDDTGNALTLVGVKEVEDSPGLDLWSETTTLYVRLLDGHVLTEDRMATVIGAGIVHIRVADFLRQLTTFRIEGPSLADRAAALTRFGKLFMGKLWDVYAKRVLPSSPF